MAMSETQHGPYPDAAAVESAILSAARNSFESDGSVSVSERIRQEYFRRFLSRVFSEAEGSEWLLKGGTGMLARVPSSRATKDVDLFRSGFTLEQTFQALRLLADVDLGDFFRFVYVSHAPIIESSGQPNARGFKVQFDIYIGAQKKSSLKVDLALGTGVTDEVQYQAPADGLSLPRLVSNPYRLYPLVDQIADKVCATMMLYAGKPSSREKDLVDLVVVAKTQRVDAVSLCRAIRTETLRRELEPFDQFIIPKRWGAAYARMAKKVPHCAGYLKVEDARLFVADFLNPVLRRESLPAIWDPALAAWVS